MPAHPTFIVENWYMTNMENLTKGLKLQILIVLIFRKNKLNSKYISKTLVNMKMGGKSSFGLINTCKILKRVSSFRRIKYQ